MESQQPKEYLIALAGNPNTGKSTVFNGLTGMRQHTGNWPGKTVSQATGYYNHQGHQFKLMDLPGIYSLSFNSPEEEIAHDFIVAENLDAIAVVVDATCLERNLNLAMQVMQLTPKVVVCLNLMDEAERHGIEIDVECLQDELGVPVVPTSARKRIGLEKLKTTLYQVATNQIITSPQTPKADSEVEGGTYYTRIEKICKNAVKIPDRHKHSFEKRIDDIVTSRRWGFPIMLTLLGLVFWITIIGANYPSELLAKMLFTVEDWLTNIFHALNSPPWLHGFLVLGVYRGLAWVISVMLPPMAIFFPLFTLLEDLGFLPRIAFNLDASFKRVGAHGKQALTMAMGFGCNAAGIIAARIIDSPRERLVAILTNNFVPCNGRFPSLIVMGTIIAGLVFGSSFRGLTATGIVLGAILLGIFSTFMISKVLTVTVLKGESSAFILELPPYRPPQVGRVIARSFLDRTLFVLGRAVVVAAPAAALTWIFANITINDTSIIAHLAGWLDPLGHLVGLDGVILLAFLLGMPANEIVIPIMIMVYLAEGAMLELDSISALSGLLIGNGWTWVTALNFIIFALHHFPCGTTLLTIWKETRNTKWTLLSALIPTVLGLVLCFIIAQTSRWIGI